jgi:outer membrane protein assembly factor BamB
MELFPKEKTMKIDSSRRGQLPTVEAPVPFKSPESQIGGWKVTIPGNHPLATPALGDGRVFLGGGFGSYEFYALDAVTGKLSWQYQTEDDGPTAAVVADERVVFNTESCELEVLTVTGRRVWKKWLGDPLLSMPAVEDGRVFMAYPDSQGDHRHYLACFDLATGNEIWRQAIVGEVITCPVLADGQVYAASLDGTLACFDQASGRQLWQEARKATSAPAVWKKQCYYSERQEMVGATEAEIQQMEMLVCRAAAGGSPTHHFAGTVDKADYLDHDKRQRRSPHYARHAAYDGGVGFAYSKGDAKIHQAMLNLGTAHVSGVWSYQGSKPFVSRGRLFSGQGDTVHCTDPESKEVFWKRKLREGDAGAELLDSLLTPPAAVNGKLFFGTSDGRVFCLSAESGETLWSVVIDEPVMFQPAVAQGRVYVPTVGGNLYCLETGDPEDDGWLMWGATPAHNGLAEVMV